MKNNDIYSVCVIISITLSVDGMPELIFIITCVNRLRGRGGKEKRGPSLTVGTLLPF